MHGGKLRRRSVTLKIPAEEIRPRSRTFVAFLSFVIFVLDSDALARDPGRLLFTAPIRS